VIALSCFIIVSVIFVNAMFTERLTTDDCLWIAEYNNVKLDSGVFIVEIIPGGVADEAGLQNGDILVAINGTYFKNSTEAQRILNGYGTGDVLTYTVIRDSNIMNFRISVYKHFNVLFLIFSMLGFGFLVIGFLVGYSKPGENTSILFFFLGCTASLAFSAIGSFGFLFGDNLIIYPVILGQILFYPLFIHFFLTYPVRIEFKGRNTIILLLYLVPAGFILLFQFVGRLLDFLKIESELSQVFINLNFIPLLLFISYIIGGTVIFVRSYFKIKDESLKKPLRIILYGFMLGLAGFIYLYFISFLPGKPNFLIQPWLLIPSALVLFIPFSFGYSIFKYRILDTEFIVKRGLVFGLITSFIVGLYLLLVLVLDLILSQYVRENRQLLTVAIIIIVTFSFDFVNKKAKEFVDKQFYRERYNYRKSLLLFSEELPFLGNIIQILQRLKKSVEETMNVKNFNVWITDEDYMKILSGDLESGNESIKKFNKPDGYDEAFYELFKEDKEPKILTNLYISELKMDDKHKEVLRNENYSLSVPIYIKGKLAGAMNFGEKASGKAYSDEDIDLLKTLASQASIAFENARLQKEQISKQKIEEELQIARRIQMGLLPSTINSIEGLEIDGTYIPAKVIGGDFYDVIHISDKKLLIVVADVSGKGIPAALYMSKVQAMIQFAAKIFQSPKEILTEVNKQIYDKIERKSFITSVIALFDLEEMKVKICRAGHNPVIYSSNGSLRVLKNKGMGLGLEADKLFTSQLEETEIDIKDESIFLFYSDGLTEAMNSKRDEYGTERVFDILKDHKLTSINKIKENILKSVSAFRGEAEQNDDITFVITKFKKEL
jgi:serine phosphatase RsbU (regulator of sigma subunit)